MQHGDPVRIGLVASGLSTTSVAIQLFIPGSNNTYPFAATDFLYLTSLAWDNAGKSVDLLSAPAGATAPTSSTLMLPLDGTSGGGTWFATNDEGMSGPQGVVPSVLTTTGSTNFYLGGTGFVVHSPGLMQSWRAPNS